MYRILKKAFSLVIALTLLLGIGLSSAHAMDYQYAGHRDPIILYENSLAGLARGDTLQLGISGGAVVSCSSSNGKIASIDPTGLVTAKKAGKTKIYEFKNGMSANEISKNFSELVVKSTHAAAQK